MNSKNTKINGLNEMNTSTITDSDSKINVSTHSENIDPNQYLTFSLEDETFAFDISRIREVLEYTRITKVPKTPGYLRGVINLRGRVVPVIDIKQKFGIGKTETSINTCIIIVELFLEGEMTILGAMGDSVREVIELEPHEIEPPPRIGTKLNTSFIKGMGKKNEQFLMILDIDKIFSLSELSIT